MKIILLSYLIRSGSTLICNSLMKDLRFCVCPEAEILTNLLLKNPKSRLKNVVYKKITKAIYKDPKLKHWNIEIPNFENIGVNLDLFKIILKLYALKSNSKSEYLVFKSEGLEKFDVSLHKNFYKIILFRDPRAVFLSQRNNIPSLGIGKMNINPIKLVHKMNKLILSYNYKENKLVYVQYENFLSNNESELNKISSMLNLKTFLMNNEDKSILNIIPANQKHLHKNINKKSMVSSVDKWKNQLSKYEIHVIQENLNKVLDLGYESYHVIISDFEKLKSYILIEIKDIFNRSLKMLVKIFK